MAEDNILVPQSGLKSDDFFAAMEKEFSIKPEKQLVSKTPVKIKRPTAAAELPLLSWTCVTCGFVNRRRHFCNKTVTTFCDDCGAPFRKECRAIAGRGQEGKVNTHGTDLLAQSSKSTRSMRLTRREKSFRSEIESAVRATFSVLFDDLIPSSIIEVVSSYFDYPPHVSMAHNDAIYWLTKNNIQRNIRAAIDGATIDDTFFDLPGCCSGVHAIFSEALNVKINEAGLPTIDFKGGIFLETESTHSQASLFFHHSSSLLDNPLLKLKLHPFVDRVTLRNSGMLVTRRNKPWKSQIGYGQANDIETPERLRLQAILEAKGVGDGVDTLRVIAPQSIIKYRNARRFDGHEVKEADKFPIPMSINVSNQILRPPGQPQKCIIATIQLNDYVQRSQAKPKLYSIESVQADERKIQLPILEDVNFKFDNVSAPAFLQIQPPTLNSCYTQAHDSVSKSLSISFESLQYDPLHPVFQIELRYDLIDDLLSTDSKDSTDSKESIPEENVPSELTVTFSSCYLYLHDSSLDVVSKHRVSQTTSATNNQIPSTQALDNSLSPQDDLLAHLEDAQEQARIDPTNIVHARRSLSAQYTVQIPPLDKSAV